MIRILFVIISLIPGISLVTAPGARGEDSVTYEVTSDDVDTANIEYFDRSQRKVVEGVPLPWRTQVAVVEARSASTRGAEVRADWRSAVGRLPVWQPGRFVTVRIYFRGAVICENTLDVGNAACYGSANFKN